MKSKTLVAAIIGIVLGAAVIGQAERDADRDELKRTTPMERTESRIEDSSSLVGTDKPDESTTDAATDEIPAASLSPLQPVVAPESGTPVLTGDSESSSAARDPQEEPDILPTSPSDAAAVYEINWSSINVGGGSSSSPNYENDAASGETAVGESSSSTYTLQSGYMYGAFTVVNGCECDCHGDPLCNGVVNVFDVVSCVDEAFRGGSPVTDPNPNCPASSDNDVAGCNDIVNVFDVVAMVDVAFRGADPNAAFCDPCL